MTGPIFTLFLYSKEKCKREIIKYLIEARAFYPEKAIDIRSVLRSLENFPWRSALEDLIKNKIIIPAKKSIDNKAEINMNKYMEVYLNKDNLTLYIRRIRLKAVITLILLITLSYILQLIGFIAGRLQTLPWQLPLTGHIIIIILSIIGWILMFPQYLVWLPYVSRRNTDTLSH
mgnify:CR=1 FL=1